jgi:hypothetical protein
MAQLVGQLLHKHEALCSNLNTAKKKRKKERKRKSMDVKE